MKKQDNLKAPVIKSESRKQLQKKAEDIKDNYKQQTKLCEKDDDLKNLRELLINKDTDGLYNKVRESIRDQIQVERNMV